MNEKIDISIVIPAFNERQRLPRFLDKVISYCRNSSMSHEIIIVDDGSSDGTFEAASSYRAVFKDLDVIRLEANRGKGFAVKTGLMRSRGRACLFIDADGSVSPDEIGKNIHFIFEDGYDIFIGSRVLKGDGQTLKTKWYRRSMGAVFNFLVHSVLFTEIKDSQCGFKIFRRGIVEPLFSSVRLEGFGFDMEALYLAYKMGYKVKEGPVSWHSVDGSKINLVTDSFGMFLNIFQIRNWHHGSGS